MTSSTDIHSFVPYVFESTGRGERQSDLLSQIFHNGTIFFFGEVNNDSARVLCAQLMYLAKEDSNREIQMYINSPGGSVYDAIAIIDTMKRIPNPISTIVIGHGFSAGALIAAAGTKGRRKATLNSTIMIHQPSGGSRGTALDMMKTVNEIKRIHDLIVEFFEDFTGLGKAQLSTMLERDYYMSAYEAKNFNFVDEVIPSYDQEMRKVKDHSIGEKINSSNENLQPAG